MIGSIVYQLTKNLTLDQIKEGGFQEYFVDHTTGIYPQSSSGVPFSAAALAVKGDPITDIHEDLAAEQKARTTYDNILRFCDDPDVKDAIRFLREREVVHYQRFGETNSTYYLQNNPVRNLKYTYIYNIDSAAKWYIH